MNLNQGPALAEAKKMLEAFYAAINRNDPPALLAFCDPDIVRVEPEGFPMSGTYRGHAELAAHIARARATWAEGACTPEGYIPAGDKMVVLLHVHVRLKDQTEWIDGQMADVFTLRNGKVIEMRSFGEKEDALAWAGVHT